MKKLLATLISSLFATVAFAQATQSTIEQSKGAVAGTQKTQAAARGGPIPAEAIPTPPQPAAPTQPVAPGS